MYYIRTPYNGDNGEAQCEEVGERGAMKVFFFIPMHNI